MIRTFKHKGLEAFFKTGSKAGIQPNHAPRLLENGDAFLVNYQDYH
jgi:plasmid maintenance system killer protein